MTQGARGAHRGDQREAWGWRSGGTRGYGLLVLGLFGVLVETLRKEGGRNEQQERIKTPSVSLTMGKVRVMFIRYTIWLAAENIVNIQGNPSRRRSNRWTPIME